MFRYSKGVSLTFPAIAKNHFQGLKAIKHTSALGIPTYYAQSVIRRAEKHAIGNGTMANFFKDLIKNGHDLLERIITGDNAELQKVIAEFVHNQRIRRYPKLMVKKRKNGTIDPKCFYRKIQDVFDYDTFVKKDSPWNAYDLTEALGIRVCAYCNRNFTFTLARPDMIVSPELDHFLPKSDYPYLALSFYNLVTSCHICNSNLKHKTAFNHRDFIHPYDFSFHDNIRSSLKIKNRNALETRDELKSFGIQFFYGDPNSFEIVLKSRKSPLTVNDEGKFDSAFLRKAINNDRVFKITDLYNHHKDMVIEMIQAARLYDDDYVDQLFRTYGGQLFRSCEDVLRTVTRNYHLIEEMPNRPFSKLTKDVFEELGLTYGQP